MIFYLFYISIAKDSKRKTLYDITNIKRIDQNRSTSANAFTTSLVNSVASNIPQANNNVNSDTSSTTKYSIPINKNNTQELENSSFILKKYEGSNIDITNLKENDSMLRLHYKRKYNKDKWEDAYYSNISNLKDKMFSIQQDSNGNKYVKADRKVLTGNNPLIWEMQIEKYINDKIRNNQDVNVIAPDGDILTITKDTAGKAKFRNYYIDKNGNKHYMNNNEFYTKLSAEAHIDELGSISKKINKKIIPDYKNHNFAINGFNYRTAFFEDFNGDYYKLTMSVGTNGKINTIYNVGKLEQRKRPVISGSSVNNGAIGSLTANNIPQTNNNVNSGTSSTTKYSIPTNKNNTQIKGLDYSSFRILYNLRDIQQSISEGINISHFR